jgi:hypothetical protein
MAAFPLALVDQGTLGAPEAGGNIGRLGVDRLQRWSVEGRS